MKRILLLVLFCSVYLPLRAQIRQLTIASDPAMRYGKVGVVVLSGDRVVVVYQAIAKDGGRSDIYAALVEGEKVTQVGNISDSSARSLEPDVAVSSSGTVHFAWFDDKGGGVYDLRYRTISGTTPSSIVTLGTVRANEGVEDLRLAADASDNAAVVWMNWESGGALCYMATKYPGRTAVDAFPLGQRAKHPDVVMDSSNIHVVWQYTGSFTGNVYSILYARRPNRAGSSFETPINLNHPDAQRPRLALDLNNYPYVVYYEDSGDTRQIYGQYWNGSRFTDKRVLGNPGREESYHFLDMAAYSVNDMIMTSQRGGSTGGDGINYNWKLNGQWSGYGGFSLPGRPASQSTALSRARPLVAVAWADRDEAVRLYLEQRGDAYGDEPPDPPPPEVPNVPPTANLQLSTQSGLAPLTVQMDGRGSSDSDGQIVSYLWTFGDGASGQGAVVQYVYQNVGTYTVTLTVTDNRGATAQATAQVQVMGLFPPLNVVGERRVNRSLFHREYYYRLTWERNPQNATVGANIVSYKIFRSQLPGGRYLFHTTVTAADQNVYLDRSPGDNSELQYQYHVVAVDDQGRESDPPPDVPVAPPPGGPLPQGVFGKVNAGAAH